MGFVAKRLFQIVTGVGCGLVLLCGGLDFCHAQESSEAPVTVIETDLETGEVRQHSKDLKPISQEMGPRVEVKFIPDRKSSDVKPESSWPAAVSSNVVDEDKLKEEDYLQEPEESSSAEDLGQEDTGQLENKRIIQLNDSLREMIEQNTELLRQNQELDRDLRSFRGQKRIDSTRITTISVERDSYKKQAERILTIKERLEDNIAQFKKQQQQKEKDLQEKIARLEKKIAQQDTMLAEGEGKEPSLAEGSSGRSKTTKFSATDPAKKSLKVLSMLNKFAEETQEAQKDEGKIHYNMGNIFFHQGQYNRAAQEYRKAVELMPDDSNAHFNLAFVSSEYTLDTRTALKHYKLYLQLNPEAEDAALVREKILSAELDLSSRVNSSLEKDLADYRRNMYEKDFGNPNE